MATPALRIAVDTRKVVPLLNGMPGLVKVELQKRLTALGRKLRNELRNELPRRSGKARKSVKSKALRSRRHAGVYVWGSPKIAPHIVVLEKGATVRPKHGPFLAIPLPTAQTGRGIQKFTAAELRASPESFGYTDTWVTGRAVMGKRRRGGRPVPLFALVRSAIVPRGGYFRDKARQRRGLIEQTIRAGIDAATKRRITVKSA